MTAAVFFKRAWGPRSPTIHRSVIDRERFFAESTWTAGVIGLGYVGLPLVVTASKRGLSAVGFDVSDDRVVTLNSGVSPVDDIDDQELGSVLEQGVRFTTDAAALADADAIFICVPSPLGQNREPDLSYIESAAQTVAEVARPGQLICLESTTYPGTTEDYILPAVEKAGLVIDEDVWVAYSPERVSPGDEMKTGDIPRLVGGVTVDSGRVAAAAYSRFVPSVHLLNSARAAESSRGPGEGRGADLARHRFVVGPHARPVVRGTRCAHSRDLPSCSAVAKQRLQAADLGRHADRQRPPPL